MLLLYDDEKPRQRVWAEALSETSLDRVIKVRGMVPRGPSGEVAEEVAGVAVALVHFSLARPKMLLGETESCWARFVGDNPQIQIVCVIWFSGGGPSPLQQNDWDTGDKHRSEWLAGHVHAGRQLSEQEAREIALFARACCEGPTSPAWVPACFASARRDYPPGLASVFWLLAQAWLVGATTDLQSNSVPTDDGDDPVDDGDSATDITQEALRRIGWLGLPPALQQSIQAQLAEPDAGVPDPVEWLARQRLTADAAMRAFGCVLQDGSDHPGRAKTRQMLQDWTSGDRPGLVAAALLESIGEVDGRK